MTNEGNDRKENIHEKHRTRMRKKFLEKGIGVFDDHQILEFLLYGVYTRKNTNPIGHALMKRFKTLEGVFSASYSELCKVEGVGDVSAAFICFVGQLRNRLSISDVKNNTRLSATEEAGKYCQSFFRGLSTERVIIISLSSSKNVIAVDVVSDGSSNSAPVDVRKIVEIALMRKATGIIISHNHPDDNPHPSTGDIALTERIIRVLEGIDISVVDHIVCGENSFVSMSERGIMETI